MDPYHNQAASRLALDNALVSRDFVALASHMSECQRSRGHFFILRSVLETVHALTAPRLVTTGAVLIVCSLGVGLLALA